MSDTEIHLSISEIRTHVMDQIGYPYLIEDYGKEAIDGITDMISGILASSKSTIPIAGENMPSAHVKKRFETLNMFHVCTGVQKHAKQACGVEPLIEILY